MKTRHLSPSSQYDPELPATEAQDLLSRLQRRAERRRSVWGGHVAGYVAVNAFLAFLDLVTGGGLWFPYVAGAMAIPFVGHAIFRRRRDRLQRMLEDEIERNPGFPDRVFRPYRKLHRSMTHFLLGLGSGVAISGYLFLINIMTGGSFWSIIPAASIALPVVFHGLLLRSRRTALLKTLEAGGEATGEQSRRALRRSRRRERRNLERKLDGPAREASAREASAATVRSPGEHPLMAEARDLEERITARLETSGASGVELQGGVRDLVGEIERMCGLTEEFGAAVAGLSPRQLREDRSLMARRLEESSGDALRSQYEQAITQIDRQLGGLADLESHRELLEVRIRTGVNSLRQINLDLVRMQGDAALDDISRLVHQRTEELSRNLNDLQESYRELSDELGGAL